MKDQINKFTNAQDFIDWVQKQRRFTKKNDLSKMKFVAKLLNNPEKNLNIIHVTGTNGKGSTVAYLKNIFLKNKLNVGTFTSPYIECFNERITYNDEFISNDDLVLYANKVLETYPLLISNGYETLTFFEFITILALLYFSEKQNIDVVILEVGIGGRLDSTNICNSLISVITNVSYDHMEVLGDTLELITNEKLGIVKPNSYLITGSKDLKLIKQMSDYCQSLNTTFIPVDYSNLDIKQADLNGSIYNYKEFSNVKIKLIGEHQVENSCIALEVIKIWNEIFKTRKSKFVVSVELLYEGLYNTKWLGRFELINSEPVIYLDGGHNIDCINRVCSFIKGLNIKYKRAVISISADKALDDMVNLIDDTFDEVIFTKYTYARSANEKSLYDRSKLSNKLVIHEVSDAINYCMTNKVDFTIFIGSLYLVSEARNIFKKMTK